MCYFSKTDPMPFSKRILWEFYNNRPHWSAHKGEGVGLVKNSLEAVEECSFYPPLLCSYITIHSLSVFSVHSFEQCVNIIPLLRVEEKKGLVSPLLFILSLKKMMPTKHCLCAGPAVPVLLSICSLCHNLYTLRLNFKHCDCMNSSSKVPYFYCMCLLFDFHL